jgi:hypothetical protein
MNSFGIPFLAGAPSMTSASAAMPTLPEYEALPDDSGLTTS